MIARAIHRYDEQNGFGRLAPKVVLFDMDGTLINSMPLHAWAWSEVCRRHDIAFTAEEVYAEEGTRGMDTIKRLMLAQRGIALSDDEAMVYYDEKSRLFATLPPPEIMDGAVALLQQIHASGMLIGIVTGSSQPSLLDKIHDTFGALIPNDRIITALDVKNGKPHPEPYLIGMARCGAAPNETIVVENAPLGIISGKRSGAFVIALNTGPLRDETLLAAGADLLFADCGTLASNWLALLAVLHS